MKSVKSIIKSKLTRLGIGKTGAEYIAEAVHYCVDKGIHPMDVCLDRHIYPMLAELHFRTEDSVEWTIRRAINKAWKESKHSMWSDELNYDSRPTIRKLIVLLLEQFDY